MGEFDFIARHLAPLAGDGALGLTDDGAVIDGKVVVKDVLVAGTHFLADDPLTDIAYKALAVNASDVLAMGATPRAYLLGIVWPAAAEETDQAALAAGLRSAQERFGVTLLGGDTTRHASGREGPLTLSVTMIGDLAVPGTPLRRGGAQPGDVVFVTGTLGDAALGLDLLRGQISIADPQHQSALLAAYRRPVPPMGFQQVLARAARSAIDISDGLLADAGHLAKQSGAAIELRAADLPMSPAVSAVVAETPEALSRVITGGDDYQLLFTAPASAAGSIADGAAKIGIRVSEIGRVSGADAAGSVSVTGPDGKAMPMGDAPRGWTHF